MWVVAPKIPQTFSDRLFLRINLKGCIYGNNYHGIDKVRTNKCGISSMNHDTLHWVAYNLMKQKDASINEKVN